MTTIKQVVGTSKNQIIGLKILCYFHICPTQTPSKHTNIGYSIRARHFSNLLTNGEGQARSVRIQNYFVNNHAQAVQNYEMH